MPRAFHNWRDDPTCVGANPRISHMVLLGASVWFLVPASGRILKRERHHVLAADAIAARPRCAAHSSPTGCGHRAQRAQRSPRAAADRYGTPCGAGRRGRSRLARSTKANGRFRGGRFLFPHCIQHRGRTKAAPRLHSGIPARCAASPGARFRGGRRLRSGAALPGPPVP